MVAWNLVKACGLADRLAREVHIGLRLHEQHLLPAYLGGGGECLEAGAADAHAQLFRQGVGGHEARVVARTLIFRAGIAEADDEPGNRAG